MKLTWLGHACFALESDGYRLVLDPHYGVAGYPELRTTAHEVLCSHGHRDHAFRDGVALLPHRESPFTVEAVLTFHDPEGGSLRGENIIHVVSAEGLRIAHLGDLGHMLSQEQRAQVGACDLILCPVGGFYTLEPQLAKEELEALVPRCIVPMHYRHEPYGLPAVTGVETFLSLYPAERIRRLNHASFPFSADTAPGILVPAYEEPKEDWQN